MSTSSARAPVAFAVKAIAIALGVFAVLRFPSVERTLVQWLIDLQTTIAGWYGAPSSPGVIVNASCSGADIIALCLGVTLAYPVEWRTRLSGAAGGLLLILVLNTLRIGTLLGLADTVPYRLALVHEYVWPALLTASILLYVWLWTWTSEGRSEHGPCAVDSGARPPSMVRFVATATCMLALYALTAPWTMTSVTLEAAGAWTVSAARVTAEAVGVDASAQGTILSTPRGAFQVTPECLLTPLLPLYVGAVLAVPMPRSRRWLWLALAVPLFFVLGVLRVLVLALPAFVVGSPVMLAHGFFQLVAGGVLIGLACLVHRSSSRAIDSIRERLILRWAVAAAGAIVASVVAGEAFAEAACGLAALARLAAPHALTTLTAPGDVQGALLFMPAYQVGLLLGLWIALGCPRWTHALGALAVLLLLQGTWLVAIGEWTAHVAVAPHAVVLRAWNVAIPLGLTLAFLARESVALRPGGRPS